MAVEQPDVEVGYLDPVDAGQLTLEHTALVLVELGLARVYRLRVSDVRWKINSVISTTVGDSDENIFFLQSEKDRKKKVPKSVLISQVQSSSS